MPNTLLSHFTAIATTQIKYRAATVQKTVTTMLRSVVVEHEQPKAFVRSSKRSDRSGQTLGLAIGLSKEPTGTQVDDWMLLVP